MTYLPISAGFIEIIIGCMFAGKTEELIRRISVLRRAGKKVLVFKPRFDNRFQFDKICSHGNMKIEANLINNVSELKAILAKEKDFDALAFDEIQFFSGEFVDFFEELARKKCRIICAGLDKGYNDEFFPPVLRLLALSELVTKLLAICVICSQPASKTQRINQNKQPIGPEEVSNVIGGAEAYQARCRQCFVFFPFKP